MQGGRGLAQTSARGSRGPGALRPKSFSESCGESEYKPLPIAEMLKACWHQDAVKRPPFSAISSSFASSANKNTDEKLIKERMWRNVEECGGFADRR